MKDNILKIVLTPILFAAIIVMILSGIYSFVLLIKVAWNLMFHTVSSSLLKKLVLTILIFVVSVTVCELNDKLCVKRSEDKGDNE